MRIKNASRFYAHVCTDGMIIYYDKRLAVTKNVHKDVKCCIKVNKRIHGLQENMKAILIEELSLDMLLALQTCKIYEKVWTHRLAELNCDPSGIYMYFEDGSVLSSVILSKTLAWGNARYCSFSMMGVEAMGLDGIVLTHIVDADGKIETV
jgi:hypothetical protein